MKIIHISASYKPAYVYGGPIMSVSMLCESTKRNSKNTDVEVLTTTANGRFELPVIPNKVVDVDGVSVTYYQRLTKDHTHFSPSLLKYLHKKIKAVITVKGRIEKKKLVIHIHAWWNLVSIFSCLIAKWHNAVVVLSPRGMLTNYTLDYRHSISKKIIHFVIGRYLLNYCHIHATSEKEKLDILQFTQPKSISVIPNLVRRISNPLIGSIRPHHDNFKLLFLSRIDEKKGLEKLFYALAKTDLNWSLTIAGDGNVKYINRLKQIANALQIDKRIEWLGHVSNEKKFEILASHDLLVLVSENENFANVVIESLSVGTPVLLSFEVGLADYVTKNKLGWAVEATPAAIADIIVKISGDEFLLKKIRKTAVRQIHIDFNEQLLIEHYLSLYEKAISYK